MSEHQIVITLKPEQFLRVQKLAGAAGAKSIEMFVRQQLLAALAIEGQSSSISPEMNLEPIVTELKRLHGELRDIVAESLVAYSANFGLNEGSAAISLELQEALPFAAEDPLYSSKSPDPAATETNRYQTKEPEPFAAESTKYHAEDPEPFAAKNTKYQAQDPESFATKNTRYQSEDHEPFESIDKEERQKTGKKRAAEAEPNLLEEAPQTLPLLMPANASWTIPAMSADEFLKSAATALNVETGNQDSRDPLSELLGTDLSSGKGTAVAPDLEDDVPLSMLARHKQMASQRKAKEDKPALSKSEPLKEKALDGPASSVQLAKPDQSDLKEKSKEQNQNTATQSEKQKQNSAEAGKGPKTAPSRGTSDFLANYHPLDNQDDDSPFSGGPPPKRDQ